MGCLEYNQGVGVGAQFSSFYHLIGLKSHNLKNLYEYHFKLGEKQNKKHKHVSTINEKYGVHK
jgi:hypothetical protein